MTSERNGKKVALIIDSLNLGGAEKSVAILSRFLTEKGYDVYIFIDNHSGGTSYKYKGKIVWMSSIRTGNKKRDYRYRAYYLKKLKDQLCIKVSISFMEDYNFINILADTGDKKIVSVRTYLSSRKSEWPETDQLYRSLIPRLYNKADYVTTMTEAQGKDLEKNYKVFPKKIKIIPNISDLNIISWKGITKVVSPKLCGNSVVTIGRLVDVKAQWHLIRAMVKVINNIPDANLYILGTGPNYGALKWLSQRLGISANIHFEGFVENVSTYLLQAKLYVHTSKAEGFVNAVLDAFSAKVPVICCDVPSSPRELLAPGTEYNGMLQNAEYAEYGVLVPAPDENKENNSVILSKSENVLADAMLKILSDKQLHDIYSEKSYQRSKDFLPKKIIGDWIKLIEG